jgi:hypothetical protein
MTSSLTLEIDGQVPEGWTVLEAVVVTKCLNEEGSPQMWHTSTPGLSTWEALGMTEVIAGTLKKAMVDGFFDEA